MVNPANNVSDITAQQAADIYNGKITNWKELGGTDAPITLYTREDGSGTREVFVERALNKGSIVQSANVVNSNGAMKTSVAQDKQSIGYVGIGHVDKNVKALVFDKMVPSQENASNGTYKVTRLLFMNIQGCPRRHHQSLHRLHLHPRRHRNHQKERLHPHRQAITRPNTERMGSPPASPPSMFTMHSSPDEP